jgi:hypothetical protein
MLWTNAVAGDETIEYCLDEYGLGGVSASVIFCSSSKEEASKLFIGVAPGDNPKPPSLLVPNFARKGAIAPYTPVHQANCLSTIGVAFPRTATRFHPSRKSSSEQSLVFLCPFKMYYMKSK